MSVKSWQKQLCSVVLGTFLITQVFQAELVFAQSGNSFFGKIFQSSSVEKKAENVEPVEKLPFYDLVAILVDENIYGNSKSYNGLNSKYGSLSTTTLKSRIIRYAEDIKNQLENTKVSIIEVKDTDTVLDIRDTLEKLYLEGDGTNGEENSLAGVVLVGDIPLPVINKGGVYFPSIFPYTDFVDKVHIFNPEKKTFEYNLEVTAPKAEVWHGIIKPPKNGEEGMKLLAEYFDKNHLYHLGKPEFSEFDEKLFYADLNFQDKSQNKDYFQYYLNYINNAENLVYKRFTNKWLQKLSGGVVQEFKKEFSEVLNPNLDLVAMEKATQTVPDAFTKDLIEKYHTPYNDLFKKYLSKVNDFVEYTGRWGANKETPVGLVAKKDFYTRHYLKSVNDMLEKKVDEIVENDLQNLVPILDEIIMTGTIDKPDHPNFPVKKTFLNFSRQYYKGNDNALYINGVPIDFVDSVAKCSLYRGSVNDDSQLSYMNRTFDARTYNVAPIIGLIVKASDPEGIKAKTGGKFDYGALIYTGYHDGAADDGTVDKSGAADAKVFHNDQIVLTVAGEKITPENSLWDIVTKHIPGEKVPVTLAQKIEKKDPLGIFVLSVEYQEMGPYMVEIKGGKDSGGIPTLAANTVQLSSGKAFELTNGKYNYGALVAHDEKNGYPAVLPYFDPDDDDKEDYGGNYLQENDIILEIDKRKITEDWTIRDALYGKHVYDAVNIVRYRNGDIKTINNIDLIDLRYYTAGCDITNSFKEKPKICSPYAAKIPVFSEGGGSVPQVDGVPVQDPLKEPSPKDCYNFLPYESLKGSPMVDFPDVLDPAGLLEEFDVPDKAYTKGAENYLKDASGFYAKLVKKPSKFDWLDNGLPKQLPEIKIFNPYSLRIGYFQQIPGVFTDLFDFSVYLSDFLEHFGRMDRTDNDGDYFDTNGNGKKDVSIVQDLNKNGIIEYTDPQTNKFVPLPLEPDGKYKGTYKGEFIGGDYGLDEPDEDKTGYKFPDSWDAFNNKFLKTDEVTKFCTPTPEKGSDECAGDVDLYLNFQPHVKKWISSVVKHKEPTNDTIMAQVESGTATSLPIDDPRYIAFLLKNNKSEQKILYPNVFGSESYDVFLQSLHELETKLNGLAMLAGLEKSYSGALVSLISNPTDKKVIGSDALKDAVSWNNLNIDGKNSYVLETYLNPEKDAYISETKNGYEALYLVAQSSEKLAQRSAYLDVDLNGDTPAEDLEYTTLETSISAVEEYEEEDEDEGDGDEKCNIISCWFIEIIKWLKTTLTFTSGFQFEQACGLMEEVSDDKDFYDLVKEMVRDDDGDGVPEASEKTSRIETSVNKQALKADGKDTIEVRVAAYDSSNQRVNKDSFSQIELTVLNPPGGETAKLISPNPVPLLNGEATFLLQSTENDGNFTIYAKTINRPSNQISNSVAVKSTKKSLYLSTFITSEEENKFYTQLGTDVYSVKDADGKEVAKVDSYGNINITDNDYEVSVLVDPKKPFGLAVKNKDTGEVAGELFASLNVEEVVIDGVAIDYDKPSELYGVHIKDVAPEDSFKINPVPEDCPEFYKDVYIYQGTSVLGLVTRKGQIFVDKTLTAQVKDKIENSYVVQIKDADLNILFEVFVTPAFRTVNKLVPEKSSEESSAEKEAFIKKAFAKEAENILPADTDADDLSDITEIIIGTSPLKKDTDSDGFTDSSELAAGYNPSKTSASLFSDTQNSYEFFDEILDLYKRGILSGYADGTFKPSNKISREEFIKVDLGIACFACTKMNDNKKVEVLSEYNKKGAFPDTDITSDLLYCVAEAKNKNIVSGYDADNFKGYFLPKNFISRVEAIKVILETLDISLIESKIEGAPWYYNYIITAQKEGIFPKGRFTELDSFSNDDFIKWYSNLVSQKTPFILQMWLEDSITRGEFAYMASYVLSKFDCYKNDADSDGIPDFLEIYRFGTDPALADTDKGGVYDLPEIVYGTNPLDPVDDKPAILNLCSAISEKFGGGEIAKEFSDLAQGFYVKGNISEEYVFAEEEQAATTEESTATEPATETAQEVSEAQEETPTGETLIGTEISEIVEYTSEVLADGESVLHAKVEIHDDNGNILENDNESVVQFSILDGGSYISIPYDKVKVKNGVAETDIVSKKVSGLAYIRVEVLGKDYPAIERQIYAYPDVPSSVDLVPYSYVLKAGGVSKTPVKVILRDKNGNIAINAPYNVTLEVSDGEGIFDPKMDTDPKADGVQIVSFSEPPVVDLISAEKPETSHLYASVDMPFEEIFAEGKTLISVRDDISLKLTSSNLALKAGSDSQATIKAEIVDGGGALLSDFAGEIKFSVDETAFGNFVDDPSKNVSLGKAEIKFSPGKTSGTVTISALLPGFLTQSFGVSVLPGAPYKIKLSSSTPVVLASGMETTMVTAELYDKNDNFIYNDSATPVTFKITEATKKFGEFADEPHVKFTNGVAKALIKGKGLTGPINVIAESEDLANDPDLEKNPGFNNGLINLSAKSRISGNDISAVNPNVLFVSLLGGPFGDVTQDNYFGGNLAFSGRVQSVVSLLSAPLPEQSIASVSSNGKIELSDSTNYYISFTPANDATLSNVTTVKSIITQNPVFEMRVVPQSQSSINIIDSDLAKDASSGLYLRKISQNPDYTYKEVPDGLSILYKNDEIGRVYQNGGIEVSNPLFSTEYSVDAEYFSVKLFKGSENFSDLYFVKDIWPSVKLVDEDKSTSVMDEGVYVTPISKSVNFSETYSSYSTHSPKGYVVTDPSKPASESETFGFSYDSLEDASKHEGVGFTGNNKHMLFFAGGNTVGESNLPFASEVGVVLGDPTVKLKVHEEMKFTKDIGTMIYNGDKLMQDLVPIDYDSDDDEDLFVFYEDGEIRLLENIPTPTKYKDRGAILKLSNGIYSAVSGDFDSDKDQDLFISTKDSCKEGEVCMYLYRNNGGFFERESLDLSIKSKMYFMKAGDVDNDSDIDVVGSSTGGEIVIFYNNGSGFDYDVQKVGNLGIAVDPEANLSSNVWVHYSGMPEIPEEKFNPYLDIDDHEYKVRTLELVLSDDNAKVSQDDLSAASDYLSVEENATNASSGTKVSFNLLSEDNALKSGSYKKMTDVNGGNVEVGDTISTTIYVKNNSGSTLNNVFINDLVPGVLDMKKDSVSCAPCVGPVSVIKSGLDERPFVMSGLSIPPNGALTITYTSTVKEVPKVKINLLKNSNHFAKDDYIDIQAMPEDNPTGQVVYYHTDPSKIFGEGKRVIYHFFKTPKPQIMKQDQNTIATPLSQDVTRMTKEALKERSLDTDMDGLPNAWDDFNYVDPDILAAQNAQNGGSDQGEGQNSEDKSLNEMAADISGEMNAYAEDAAKLVENAMAFLRCSGGCLPIPINYAFLVPGDNSVMQWILTPIPPIALPVFTLITSVPGFCPFNPSSSYFRLYLSPTLTAGLGMGICTGTLGSAIKPGLANWCFAFAPPLAKMLGIKCDSIMDSIKDGIESVASSVESSVSSGFTAVQANGSQFGADVAGPTDEEAEESGFNASQELGNYSASVSGSVNIRIPPFPAVIVEWIDRQIENIIDRLTDLPDIYFIYPDMGYVAKEFNASMQGFQQMKSSLDFITALNRFPLIDIETKEVILKIPTLTPDEIKKIQNDWQQWKIDFEDEIERVKALWGCDPENTENKENEDICQKVANKFFVDATKLIQAVEKNMEAIDEWTAFPKKLLTWKNLEAKYIKQIICYMDVIITFFNGWMKKQQKRIESWIKAIEKIKKNIETWKAIIDLTLDYETSCDECKSDRFSQLEILMKLFAVIPTPPDVPLPKWPNIILDFSKLQLGLKFVLPDLRFKPARIILPPIPRIRLPDIIPSVQIKLPEIPVIPGPPEIPDLPDLPPIPLIKLPDLPKAPSIPKLPDVVVSLAASVKIILKILCLIKKGFIPIPESDLKTQIETLTQRGLSPVTLFDIGFKVKYPEISYSYVDQIKLTTSLNFQLDLDPILKLVEMFADEWNNTVDSGVKKFNKQLQDFADVIQSMASPNIPDLKTDVNLEMSNGINDYLESMKAVIEQFRNENGVKNDELRLIAKQEGSVDPKLLACDTSNISTQEASELKQRLVALAGDIKQKGAVSRLFASTEPFESTDEALKTMDEKGKDAPLVNMKPETANPVLRGLFIINPKEGLNGKLISYTEEMDIPSKIRYVDFDSDTDDDIIFTLDNNIYIKENYKTSSKKESHYDKISSGLTISDLRPHYPSINKFKVSDEGNNSADVSFNAVKYENFLGYEFILDAGSNGITKFNLVATEPNKTFVYVDGGAMLSSNLRRTLSSGSVHSNPGSTIHALKDSTLIMHYDETKSLEMELKQHEIFVVADSYVNGMQVEVFNGEVEVIDSQEKADNQALVDGMLILKGDKFKVSDGEVIIKYTEGAETVVNEGETFVFDIPGSPGVGSYNFAIDNGDYYVKAYFFDKSGKRSTASNSVILAPQICGDKTPPFPLTDSQEKTELILKEFTVSAEGSFDTDSKIVSYGLDLDSDGKIDMYASPENPTFKLGPFEKPQTFNAKLVVTDEANNAGTVDLVINITVPNISLDPDVSEKGFITGAISAKEPNIPIKIARKRGDSFEIIKTVSAGENGEYMTSQDGTFRIEDLDLEQKVVLKDSEGKVVGEVYPLINLKEGYKYVAHETSMNPAFPTYIEAQDSNGTTLLKFFLVADPNTDVQIDDQNTAYTKETIWSMTGVHVRDKDPNDTYIVQKVPADIEDFSGGAVLIDQSLEKELSAIDTAGNIYLLDKNTTLSVRKDNEEEPFVFEISYGKNVIAEVYVPVSSEIKKIPETISHVASEDLKITFGKELKFSDVPLNHPQYDIIKKLRELGIIEGYKTDDGISFKPEQNITRAEFAKIILKILCIYPRDEAYTPAQVFADALYKSKDDPWYFPILKETYLQGFITGYIGEKNPLTGLSPFKPNNNITRAEATKIILEAMNKIDVIKLPGKIEPAEGEAWYDPYLRIAVNLKPYEKTQGLLKTPFLLLASESLLPNKVLTRAELAELASRVLDAYNCYESDIDNDGILDNDENKYKLDPKNADDADLDPDKDKLITSKEIEIGTDPFDPDTDDGGATDFEEVQNGTNPVDNPEDDKIKEEKPVDQSGDFGEGVYMELPECNTCPCPSSVGNSADLVPYDTIFAIISNDDNSEIYSKSNEIQILKTQTHAR